MKHYSKKKQDKWVIKTFEEKRDGFFVDLGAYDGINGSNTKTLEASYGWTGICVEASRINCDTLKNKREKSTIILNECIWDEDDVELEFLMMKEASGVVNPDTRWNEERFEKLRNNSRKRGKFKIVKMKTKSLLTILKENNAPKKIDFLSMDLEGAEEKIINSALLKEYKFSCIIVEIYKEFSSDRSGNKKTVVLDVLKENGYELVKQEDSDFFYILGENK